MACTGCTGKGLKGLVSGKLGRCPKCMRWSARGTFISCAVAAVVYFVLPNPYLIGLSLLVVTSFTLLWIAHIVTFTFLTLKFRTAVVDQVRHTGNKIEPQLSRREFVPMSLKLLGLSLLISIVPRSVVGSIAPNFKNLKCRDIPSESCTSPGLKRICAATRAEAYLIYELQVICDPITCLGDCFSNDTHEPECRSVIFSCACYPTGEECDGGEIFRCDCTSTTEIKCRCLLTED